jgi:hypothetical protein
MQSGQFPRCDGGTAGAAQAPGTTEVFYGLPSLVFATLWDHCNVSARSAIFATCKGARELALQHAPTLQSDLGRLEAGDLQTWQTLQQAGARHEPLHLTLRTGHQHVVDSKRVLQQGIAHGGPGWASSVSKLILKVMVTYVAPTVNSHLSCVGACTMCPWSPAPQCLLPRLVSSCKHPGACSTILALAQVN